MSETYADPIEAQIDAAGDWTETPAETASDPLEEEEND